LGIWGVGMLIAGIFPVEVEAYPDTRFGWIHILSILWSFFCLTLSTILLSRHFKQDENWHRFYCLALILALVTLAASLLFFYELLFPSNRLFDNLSPGIYIVTSLVTGLIWLLLTAVRLRFVAVGSVSKR